MIMMVLETIRIEIEISEFIFFRFVSYLIEKKHATITLILNERTNYYQFHLIHSTKKKEKNCIQCIISNDNTQPEYTIQTWKLSYRKVI